MPTLLWFALGFGVWTLCGLLAISVAAAARRGDRLSSDALMGMDPAVQLQPRRRVVVDVTPVARPWAAAAAAPVASPLAEVGGPLS